MKGNFIVRLMSLNRSPTSIILQTDFTPLPYISFNRISSFQKGMQLKKEFIEIVRDAWYDYDANNRPVVSIQDISAKVSTNHVFMIDLATGEKVIGKLSYFGNYENFLEDHTLINSLALNLPAPYEYFVSHSLTKQSQVYTYRYKDSLLDAWVVFYKPIRIDQALPKRLEKPQIENLGRELAKFHKTCTSIAGVLPFVVKDHG